MCASVGLFCLQERKKNLLGKSTRLRTSTESIKWQFLSRWIKMSSNVPSSLGAAVKLIRLKPRTDPSRKVTWIWSSPWNDVTIHCVDMFAVELSCQIKYGSCLERRFANLLYSSNRRFRQQQNTRAQGREHTVRQFSPNWRWASSSGFSAVNEQKRWKRIKEENKREREGQVQCSTVEFSYTTTQDSHTWTPCQPHRGFTSLFPLLILPSGGFLFRLRCIT